MIDYAALKAEIGKIEYKGLTDQEIADKLLSATTALPGEGHITPSEFVARFADKALAIKQAAETDSYVFNFWLQLNLAQGRIDLTDPRIAMGLGLLVQRGLIAQEDVPVLTAVPAGKTVTKAETFGYIPGVNDLVQEILAAKARR